jgi:hypothetical protein
MILRCFDIDSSAVSALVYDDHKQVLDVNFEGSDGWYRYERVSDNEFEDLRRAKSMGRHINYHIVGEKASKKFEGDRPNFALETSEEETSKE